MIVVAFALVGLVLLPRFWLLGIFMALAAIVGAVNGDLEQGIYDASLLLIAGPITVLWTKATNSMWRVERERWDRADRGEPDV